VIDVVLGAQVCGNLQLLEVRTSPCDHLYLSMTTEHRQGAQSYLLMRIDWLWSVCRSACHELEMSLSLWRKYKGGCPERR